MPDPHDLARFVKAQDHTGTYDDAVRELRAGRKTSHWMWFVFPQIAGLGHSATSQTYAIASLAEARAYLEHPVLGPRLVECSRIVAGHAGATAQEIFGETEVRAQRPADLRHRSTSWRSDRPARARRFDCEQVVQELGFRLEEGAYWKLDTR